MMKAEGGQRDLESDIAVAVVIPCYRVKEQVLEVIRRIGPECSAIYVVDDACPDGSGALVDQDCSDPRVHVIRHERNQGVGGAVVTGYRRAIEDGASVIVKLDGDGQMAPELLPYFVEPILAGHADYTKGNRFYDLTHIRRMPTIRILGNAVLSFMAKLSTGYWDIFDPTNGYTAIHASVAEHIPLEKISKRYFFETDLLFRLSTIRAVVVDVPMFPQYGGESSNLRVGRVIPEFTVKHLRNFGKRIFYNYFLRDVSIASLELVVGMALLLFGVIFGIASWIQLARHQEFASAGTVMLAALPVISGIQFLLAFLGYDINSVPRRAIHPPLTKHTHLGALRGGE